MEKATAESLPLTERVEEANDSVSEPSISKYLPPGAVIEDSRLIVCAAGHLYNTHDTYRVKIEMITPDKVVRKWVDLPSTADIQRYVRLYGRAKECPDCETKLKEKVRANISKKGNIYTKPHALIQYA
jgi:hypothetical protein